MKMLSAGAVHSPRIERLNAKGVPVVAAAECGD